MYIVDAALCSDWVETNEPINIFVNCLVCKFEHVKKYFFIWDELGQLFVDKGKVEAVAVVKGWDVCYQTGMWLLDNPDENLFFACFGKGELCFINFFANLESFQDFLDSFMVISFSELTLSFVFEEFCRPRNCHLIWHLFSISIDITDFPFPKVDLAEENRFVVWNITFVLYVGVHYMFPYLGEVNPLFIMLQLDSIIGKFIWIFSRVFCFLLFSNLAWTHF